MNRNLAQPGQRMKDELILLETVNNGLLCGLYCFCCFISCCFFHFRCCSFFSLFSQLVSFHFELSNSCCFFFGSISPKRFLNSHKSMLALAIQVEINQLKAYSSKICMNQKDGEEIEGKNIVEVFRKEKKKKTNRELNHPLRDYFINAKHVSLSGINFEAHKINVV